MTYFYSLVLGGTLLPAGAAVAMAAAPVTQLLGVLEVQEIAAGLGGLAVLLGLWKVIQMLQGIRSGITKEVKREMAADQAEKDGGRMPQPLIVAQQVRYATEAQLAAVHEQIRELRVENSTEMLRLSDRFEAYEGIERDRTGRLHARVDKLQEVMGGATAKLETVAAGVSAIQNILITKGVQGKGGA